MITTKLAPNGEYDVLKNDLKIGYITRQGNVDILVPVCLTPVDIKYIVAAMLAVESIEYSRNFKKSY